jgi:hypothetical protein
VLAAVVVTGNVLVYAWVLMSRRRAARSDDDSPVD